MAKKKSSEHPIPPEEQVPDISRVDTPESERHEDLLPDEQQSGISLPEGSPISDAQPTDMTGDEAHPTEVTPETRLTGDIPQGVDIEADESIGHHLTEDDILEEGSGSNANGHLAGGESVSLGFPLLPVENVATLEAEGDTLQSRPDNFNILLSNVDDEGNDVSTDDDIPPTDEDGDVASGSFDDTSADILGPPRGKAKRTTRKKKGAEATQDDLTASPPSLNAALGFTPGVLTIEARAEIESEQYQEDTAWHEIRNAYRTRRILTGILGGLEQTEDGKTLIIVEYQGFRIVIPMKEMMLNLGRWPSGTAYVDLMRRQNQILSTMMGAEIDFIVRGIENKSRSIVASRKEAMLKKRQIFYLSKDDSGMYRIYEGRLVQARVIAVAEKVIRVEVFGVECAIMARDLAWDWMGDAHERFSVGDRIVVRVLEIQRNSLEDIAIRADVKSVSNKTDLDNLKKCRIQGKYAGRVTDIHKGVVFLRLTNGVNAIAHSCFDRRMPGKKDDVSFAVTHIDDEQGVAVGIITRIIKQNL